VGRLGDTLYFNRTSDGRRYELPLSQLSRVDRWLAFRYPEDPPPQVPKPRETDPYITNRLERIRELREKHEVIASEINSRTLSDLLQAKREIELQEIENEIAEMEVAIESYKWRNKR